MEKWLLFQSLGLPRWIRAACSGVVIGSGGRRLPGTRLVQSLGGEDPLEEGTATPSSILSWRILWTEESSEDPMTGGLQSMGS